MLEDTTLCTEKMLAGSPLSDIMGFSQKALIQFYEAAKRLMKKNEMQKCYDAFSFLATIAPQYPLFWLGLGYTSAKCGDTERAIRACEHAIELAPNDSQGYVITADVFKESGDVTKAREVCKQGLEHADRHKNEAMGSRVAQ